MITDYLLPVEAANPPQKKIFPPQKKSSPVFFFHRETAMGLWLVDRRPDFAPSTSIFFFRLYFSITYTQREREPVRNLTGLNIVGREVNIFCSHQQINIFHCPFIIWCDITNVTLKQIWMIKTTRAKTKYYFCLPALHFFFFSPFSPQRGGGEGGCQLPHQNKKNPSKKKNNS